MTVIGVNAHRSKDPFILLGHFEAGQTGRRIGGDGNHSFNSCLGRSVKQFIADCFQLWIGQVGVGIKHSTTGGLKNESGNVGIWESNNLTSWADKRDPRRVVQVKGVTHASIMSIPKKCHVQADKPGRVLLQLNMVRFLGTTRFLTVK